MAPTKKRARRATSNNTTTSSDDAAAHPDDEYAIRSLLDCRRTATGRVEYLVDWAPHSCSGERADRREASGEG